VRLRQGGRATRDSALAGTRDSALAGTRIAAGDKVVVLRSSFQRGVKRLPIRWQAA
jgi:hypothetical protein